MTNCEKAEMLKETIGQLYSKEGRSKSYISRLLVIDRRALVQKISEWKLPEAEPRHHFTPSVQKFVDKNREYIKSQLDKDVPVTKIASALGVSRDMLQKTVIPNDEVLKKAHEDYISRIHTNAKVAREHAMDKSSRDYRIVDMPGERWEAVLGYPRYMVSNMGRIKSYVPSYQAYRLITAFPNKNNGRLYVMLYNEKGAKNLALARLVAHAFVKGYGETANTVNHKDGDVSNNKASNLEWSSQGENNAHAYRELGRRVNIGTRPSGRIKYLGRYEFKTVAAFSRFLGKSETQTRRYMEQPHKYGIELVR